MVDGSYTILSASQQQETSTRRRRSRKPAAEIPGSGAQPPIAADAFAQSEPTGDTPKRKSRNRQERSGREQNQRDGRQDARQGRQRQQTDTSGANSFNEGNLPAFLQRPVRAEKPAKKAPRSTSKEPPAQVDS